MPARDRAVASSVRASDSDASRPKANPVRHCNAAVSQNSGSHEPVRWSKDIDDAVFKCD